MTTDDNTHFRWRIASVEFSGGQTVPLEAGSVLVLIGPNRSGKSTALRDIQAACQGGETGHVVVSTAIKREGSPDSFVEWLTNHYATRDILGQRNFETPGSRLTDAAAISAWNQGETMRQANAFLVHRLNTEDRLTITKRQASIPREEQQRVYIHTLQRDDDLVQRISEQVEAAFGEKLIIHRAGGPYVWFHVGGEPNVEGDRVSNAYLNQLEQLPLLEEEGDGIRSFVGTLLAAECSPYPVLLVDEPEAFLHPPQAQHLARILAGSAARLSRQVIMATHSADVLQGALAESEKVSVCRITRQGSVNEAALLSGGEISELWTKPILRSSSAMDGVFHRGVVICEGDADTRFYEGLVRRLEDAGGHRADLYFVHGSGTGQLITLARAYAALKTRTAIVADLDILRHPDLLAGVVATLGGNLEEDRRLYNVVVSALGSLPPVASAGDFLSRASAILDQIRNSNEVTAEHRHELQALITNAADWSQPKKSGLAGLQGEPASAADELFSKWKSVGLFIVQVGELERWYRAGSADKRMWFPEAIQEIAARPDSLTEATSFVRQIMDWFKR